MLHLYVMNVFFETPRWIAYYCQVPMGTDEQWQDQVQETESALGAMHENMRVNLFCLLFIDWYYQKFLAEYIDILGPALDPCMRITRFPIEASRNPLRLYVRIV